MDQAVAQWSLYSRQKVKMQENEQTENKRNDFILGMD